MKDHKKNILLFNVKDITLDKIPAEYIQYENYLKEFGNWVSNFLAKPHSDLGRTGAVCPYVQYSEEKEYFKVGMFQDTDPEQDEIIDLITELKDVFVQMNSANKKDEKFKAITILFPNLNDAKVTEIIDGVQHKLKPEFVKQGMMIGQFYENCQEGGLRNSNFRPLQSPIPLLAIRYMVETDWPFLEGDRVLELAYQDNFGKINFGTKKD